jgi:hypothetical protein
MARQKPVPNALYTALITQPHGSTKHHCGLFERRDHGRQDREHDSSCSVSEQHRLANHGKRYRLLARGCLCLGCVCIGCVCLGCLCRLSVPRLSVSLGLLPALKVCSPRPAIPENSALFDLQMCTSTCMYPAPRDTAWHAVS